MTVPSLVVVGAADAVTPPAEAEALARTIPGARVAHVADAGHQVPVEQADALSRLAVEFAERSRQALVAFLRPPHFNLYAGSLEP